MTEADYRRRSGEILSVFGEAPNVRVLDFNEWNDTWRPEHFIDWWHRTVDGERQFAEVMAKWLSGEL